MQTGTIMTIFLMALTALTLGCTDPEEFAQINQSVASPIDVAVGDDGKYFYALNADFDRTYNTGSILVISEDGDKVGAVQVPRLGRAIAVAGNDLIAVYDKYDDDSDFAIHLYDLSNDPTKPELVKQWTKENSELEDFDCTPINIAMRTGYKHFAVTCRIGKLFLGTLETPRTNSELKLVRDYGKTRRAMYLDSQKELLIQFPTDMDFQRTTDLLADDTKTFDDETGRVTNKPNEVPDQYEDTKFRRRSLNNERRRFQFSVYDIAAEREKGFPRLDIDQENDEKAINKELRWTYFTLRDFDHSPDTSAGITDLKSKHYRTNFWAAHPDPLDPNAFYLSHRGKHKKQNRYANSIIRVSITGDLTQTDPVPFTKDVLSFERVYGFSGELDPKNHFPGDFEVKFINGRLTLIVNHFKDHVNFRGKAAFSVAAKLLDGGQWRRELSSTSSSNSYYQLAVNERGKALVCSFYGDALIPLVVDPGANMTVGWNNIERID